MSVAIDQQITEIDREIALRISVYPTRIARQAMTQDEATQHIDGMRAIKATLMWLRDNRVPILAAVKAAKVAAPPVELEPEQSALELGAAARAAGLVV